MLGVPRQLPLVFPITSGRQIFKPAPKCRFLQGTHLLPVIQSTQVQVLLGKDSPGVMRAPHSVDLHWGRVLGPELVR